MLEKFDFLDVESALPYVGGDEDIFEEVVATYVEENKSDKVQKAFDELDWDNYRILVHGIKSTSYTIGANALGDEAKESEMCVKTGDFEGAKARHAQLMTDYKAMIDKISSVI